MLLLGTYIPISIPIAVGFTIRRLAAKIIMYDCSDFCEKEFCPYQVGVGTPKGAEARVHALRAYLSKENSEDKVILKVDFKNAFNSNRRDVILGQSKNPKIFQLYSSVLCPRI